MLVLLILLPLVAASVSALTLGKTEDCEVYEAELRSYPDFSRRVMTASVPLPPDFSISQVQQDLSKGRSFYWCEMKVKYGDGLKIYRHFGHNSSTWWVSKGCGGWFHIKACRSTAGQTSDADDDSNSVDPYETPTIVTVVSAAGDGKDEEKNLGSTESQISENVKDYNPGSLWSLYHWLAEQKIPVNDKLGGSPNRVARSVDEDFAAEFGFII